MTGNILGSSTSAIVGEPVDCVSKLAAHLDDFKLGRQIRLTVMPRGTSREMLVILLAWSDAEQYYSFGQETMAKPQLFSEISEIRNNQGHSTIDETY